MYIVDSSEVADKRLIINGRVPLNFQDEYFDIPKKKAGKLKKLISILTFGIFFTSCAHPQNDCKKVYQEVYVSCKPLPLGGGESCSRQLVELCESDAKPKLYGVPR